MTEVDSERLYEDDMLLPIVDLGATQDAFVGRQEPVRLRLAWESTLTYHVLFVIICPNITNMVSSGPHETHP